MIEGIIKNELDKAELEYGSTFASDHEAYAVILEEVEEVWEALAQVGSGVERLWHFTKLEDDTQKTTIVKQIRLNCIEAIKETAQVAAMCDKYMNKE